MGGDASALVVGSVSRDYDAAAPGSGRPGGPVHYAGAALARLGAQTRVFTSLRAEDTDELLAPLRAAGIELRWRAGSSTTTYENDYRGERDLHRLVSVSETIRPDDVPADWRAADLIQLGPLHPNDIAPGLPSVLRGRIGIDVQGLTRQAERPVPLPSAAVLKELLAPVAVLQASASEIEALLEGESLERLAQRHALAEVIVTRGEQGATLLVDGRRTEIPARPVEGGTRVGSGDVFLACYLLARAQGRAPVESARLAAEVCAIRIERGQVPGSLEPRGEEG